jgi:hypothetical protein
MSSRARLELVAVPDDTRASVRPGAWWPLPSPEEDRFRIGRNPDYDLVVEGPAVHRGHLYIEARGRGHVFSWIDLNGVIDVESGRQLSSPAPLRDGALYDMVGYVFRYMRGPLPGRLRAPHRFDRWLAFDLQYDARSQTSWRRAVSLERAPDEPAPQLTIISSPTSEAAQELREQAAQLARVLHPSVPRPVASSHCYGERYVVYEGPTGPWWAALLESAAASTSSRRWPAPSANGASR